MFERNLPGKVLGQKLEFCSRPSVQTLAHFVIVLGCFSAAKGQKKPKLVAESSSSFMTYFVLAIVIVVVGYLVYHNKQKVSDVVSSCQTCLNDGRSGCEFRRVAFL